MAITTKQFEHITRLAYLDQEDVANQFDKCGAMIEGIEQLQTVNVAHISPLHHPTSVTQYLRPDNQVIKPNINELMRHSTTFVDGFYSVPLIIKGQQ